MNTTALFPVTVENRAAIDAKGRVRLQTQFDFARRFSEGLALCGNWDQQQTDPVTRWWKGQYGFINTQGEVVIPLEYDEARDFKDGLAPVRIGKHWAGSPGRGSSGRFRHRRNAIYVHRHQGHDGLEAACLAAWNDCERT